MKENIVKIDKIPSEIKNLTGYVDFENLNADFKLSSGINTSRINIDGKFKDNIIDTKIISDKFTLADAASLALQEGKKLPFSKDLTTISTSFIADYKGPVDNINYNCLNVKGKIYPNKGSKSTIITDGSSFTLKNSHFKLSPLQGSFKNNPYIMTADISNIMNKNQDVNGYFSM